MPDAFMLDPRLDSGSAQIADWPLSRLLLKDDARFAWLLLVPRRPGVVELTDLAPPDYDLLTAEILRATRLVQRVAAPDKINVATIGNLVPQMHVHVVGRRRDDAAWPAPIWCVGPGPAHEAGDLAALARRYREAAADTS
jgi:diadenosine tetraphosphate (Ap4A) HIT family hydrolase